MKKGITATSVAIMVVIVMMLVGTITTLSYNSIQNAKKTVFALEISSIQEAVDKYVSDSVLGEYPTIGNEYLINISGVSSAAISQFDEETKTANNEITVYEVDLSILGITDTVYGNKNTGKDVYVLSKATGRVYYLEGIKLKSTTYYTLTEDLLELKDKKIKNEEEVSNGAPVISTDGYIAKTLSDYKREVYLTNIKVTNSPKIFKYELGIISEDDAKEYFKNNGKSIVSDRLKFDSRKDITLYAENSKGEYDIKYYYLLQDNAAAAINAGLKIGDIVKYEVTAKSTTSYLSKNGSSDQEISNMTNFTWRYIGVSDNGELLIAPDIVSSATTLTLYGMTGYLNGTAELDDICDKLYTTSYGTARSIKLGDINNLMGYAGPLGGYWNTAGSFIFTTNTMKVSEIANEKQYSLSNFHTSTPDDGIDNIGDYYATFYDYTKDSDYITNKDYIDLVFYSTSYWVSTSAINVGFAAKLLRFYVRSVNSNGWCTASNLYQSDEVSNSKTLCIRPTVEIHAPISWNESLGAWVF